MKKSQQPIIKKKDLPSNVFRLDPAEAQRLISTLTKRERQTAERLAFGMTHSQIAEDLGIASDTLSQYRIRVRRKLMVTVQGIGRVWFCAKLPTK